MDLDSRRIYGEVCGSLQGCQRFPDIPSRPATPASAPFPFSVSTTVCNFSVAVQVPVADLHLALVNQSIIVSRVGLQNFHRLACAPRRSVLSE